MTLWMLFLRGGAYEAMSPDEMIPVLQRFRDWAEDLHKRGLLEAGAELCAESKRVGPRETGHQVTGGPAVPSSEIISGYFVIRALTEGEAITTAKE